MNSEGSGKGLVFRIEAAQRENKPNPIWNWCLVFIWTWIWGVSVFGGSPIGHGGLVAVGCLSHRSCMIESLCTLDLAMLLKVYWVDPPIPIPMDTQFVSCWSPRRPSPMWNGNNWVTKTSCGEAFPCLLNELLDTIRMVWCPRCGPKTVLKWSFFWFKFYTFTPRLHVFMVSP